MFSEWCGGILFFLKRSIEASSPKNHWKCKKAKMRRKNLHKFLKISDPQRVSLQAVFWQRPTRETGREGRSFVNHQGPEGSQWSYVVLVEGVMELWKILETMAHLEVRFPHLLLGPPNLLFHSWEEEYSVICGCRIGIILSDSMGITRSHYKDPY